MKKNNGKPASVMLVAGALIFGLVGCSEGLTETGSFTGTVSSTLPKELIGVEIKAEDIFKPEETVSLEENINIGALGEEEPTNNESPKDLSSYINYLEDLGLINDYFNILLHPEKHTSKELELAAYLNLKAHNLSINDVQNELHNILVYSQYPTCCDNQTFELLVGKLHKTLNYIANPFASYYVLSQKVHELTCDLKHTHEYGIYTCETLQILGEEVRPLSLEEYLDKTMGDNYGYQKIKKALIQNPQHTLDDYLIELNNLLVGQLHPSCVPEDLWYSLFGKLVATLEGYESLHETFIELAVYIHNTLNPDDQLTQDEFGIYTSRTLKYPDAY
ncbi:MAG: hypothetical protein E7167_00860 [Firmicutes bacterium]|nr:hypothetical protein [Bacillota bacterium]